MPTNGAPILDDRGGVTGVVLVFRDQTEERAALEALRTARREWQATFDALLDPVALLAPDGTVQHHHQAFASIFEGGPGCRIESGMTKELRTLKFLQTLQHRPCAPFSP